ncbi:endoglucanase [Micromonospora purpureochromogenes]|uniref:Glucanase n=1 Tax=Micromonospora purpureochromogenes TaxID=47872 RepID=A0A1C4YA59_9ACTN|nr:glycoside hydrolase family 6 protein [Micromonospora purpureochromogenes]SCF17622.1 endoglucanase [Micromonospora purpureochromogenes]
MTRRRRLTPTLVLALVAVLAAACAHRPDTTLRPDPPTLTYALPKQPFRGATLYVDRNTAAARWQAAHGADWLTPITDRPQARWVNDPRDVAPVAALAARARQRDELPVVVAYWIPNRGCANFREGAPDAKAYQDYIGKLIAALGRTRSVVVMEPDGIAADCFDATRGALLTEATRRLAAAGHAVYLDAGHSKWRSTGETAERLLAAGITYAEGFAVNVSNRQSTADSYRWGRELSDLVGGREFVIDTSRNGAGPPPDEPGRDDEWCNPRRQALGEAPGPVTGRPGLAALLWIKAPGESDGVCGGERTYLFTPTQARTLIAGATWLPAADRAAARAARPAPVVDQR